MRHYRKVIRITAERSPNVRLALAQRAAGQEPTGEELVPGVLSWAEYRKRLETWDEVRRTVGLGARFYEGAELLLFPPAWLDHAARLAESLRGRRRQALAIGCDPAEGGDQSSWAVVDGLGLLHLVTLSTPDTDVIPTRTLALMREHGVPPSRVAFDRGGGGKQHADRLRGQGHHVRTVAFGESVAPEPRRGLARLDERQDAREERYAYVNRRAQMYGELSALLDPAGPGFALPAGYAELRRQLAPVPKLYDREGRLRMLPKNRRDAVSTEKTLVELVGHSPDEADALVLAVHAMRHAGAGRSRAGAL